MNKDTEFYKQTALLLKVLPHAFENEVFALKGGTAINLFIRNLPRLSVDIDLCYLPVKDRDASLHEINSEMELTAQRIEKFFPQMKLNLQRNRDGIAVRIIVIEDDVNIKVEINHTLRGHINEVEIRNLCEKGESFFSTTCSVPCLNFNDLYAGKICAALDRQHPRDLFDIKYLIENEGISDRLRKTFLVYLISHNRPISELINPNRLDKKSIFDEEFSGMTNAIVAYEELEETREQLISAINERMELDEKEFLISFKKGEPNWSLLGIEGAEKLPAVKWKLRNIGKMDKAKHAESLDILKVKLGIPTRFI